MCMRDSAIAQYIANTFRLLSALSTLPGDISSAYNISRQGDAGVDVFWERSGFSAADQPGHFWAVKCSIAAGQTYVTFFWPPVFVSTLHSFTTEPKGVKSPMAATRALLIDCLEQAEGNSSAFRKSASTCERADWLTKDFFPKRDRSTIC